MVKTAAKESWLKYNQTMSLLCSKPFNGFLSSNESLSSYNIKAYTILVFCPPLSLYLIPLTFSKKPRCSSDICDIFPHLFSRFSCHLLIRAFWPYLKLQPPAPSLPYVTLSTNHLTCFIVSNPFILFTDRLSPLEYKFHEDRDFLLFVVVFCCCVP